MIRLMIAVPTGLVYDGRVRKLSAEAPNGSFTILPRHIDYVTTLVPGILFFETDEEESREIFFAVDEGILVKQGEEVQVSTRNAVRGTDLETLHETVHQHFENLDERERQARSVLARMEADFVRRYLESEQDIHA